MESFLREDSDGIMMRRILYQAKWRLYHPTAFACFDEISENEKLSVAGRDQEGIARAF